MRLDDPASSSSGSTRAKSGLAKRQRRPTAIAGRVPNAGRGRSRPCARSRPSACSRSAAARASSRSGSRGARRRGRRRRHLGADGRARAGPRRRRARGRRPELPFEDESFDCAVADWMLYHVPDLDRGVTELARVLRPRRAARCRDARRGEHLQELWELLGAMTAGLSLRRRERRRRCCAALRARRAARRRTARSSSPIATLDASTIVAATTTRSHLADLVPELDRAVRRRARPVASSWRSKRDPPGRADRAEAERGGALRRGDLAS